MRTTNILGIETSCDETAASVVKNGRFILSNVVASSLAHHKKYGGIIPEIASRKQIESINTVVNQALKKANVSLKNIDAVAVTAMPGLIGSLLVGISFARAMCLSIKKPLIEVDHIKAHLYANFLTSYGSKNHMPQLPAIGLVASGGHTSLFNMQKGNNYKLMGQTRDDALGEAYDKVARLLHLGYPGGPIIDRLAQKCNQSRTKFSCAELPGTFDFSFSGIKTAVMYHVKKHSDTEKIPIDQIAYAFQDSVVSTVVKKCIAACEKKNIKTLVVGGGVAANTSLRSALSQYAKKEGINVYFPPLSLCADNAAMIAGLGYHLIKAKSKNKIPSKKGGHNVFRNYRDYG